MYAKLIIFTLVSLSPSLPPSLPPSLSLSLQSPIHSSSNPRHPQVAVDEVMSKLQSLPKQDNLVPLFINAEHGQLRPGTLTLGARADTYYEYLFKQWIQSSKTEPRSVCH